MRIEQDHFGTVELDETALHGIHTARALTNFPIGGPRVSRQLISAIAEIKRAAVRVNGELGFFSPEIVSAVAEAASEIADNRIIYEFTLPAYQGGAGTSTNMCVNEVIANRALQILGLPCGSYNSIHPIETVNLHQSTNDVYPTALKMTIIRKVRALSEKIATLQGAFQKKEQEFSEIITLGRTELQDAVPMTMGSQFASFAQAIERDRWRCFKSEERIRTVNIGGTAIGTGLTAPQKYIFRVIEKLRSETGLPIGRADHTIDATANADCYVEVSSALTANAVNLIKIAMDLRFLHSVKEISLPKLQAGSSIMPGKVNPVILESVIQLAMKAKNESTLVSDCAALGSLQINEFLPLLGDAILSQIDLLSDAVTILSSHVDQITANRRICEERLFAGTSCITVFLPEIGYQKAEQLIDQFEQSGETNFRSFLESTLGENIVKEYLEPAKLMALGFRMKRT